MPVGNDASSSTEDADEVYKEPCYSTLTQIAIPFTLASFGNVMAGVILGNVEHWTVFQNMNALFVLVPVLCGLKGNLDMCLACRICTQSNLGNMKEISEIYQLAIGNMALVQVQAIVCSFISCVVTSLIWTLIERKTMFRDFAIMSAAAIFSSTTSCGILDSFIIFIIIFSQRYRFNPDYMATPIIASLGDVLSITLLAFSGGFLYKLSHTKVWIIGSVVGVYLLLLLPLYVTIVMGNKYTHSLLFSSWFSVFGALFISQFGGYVLSSSVNKYRGFSIFSPIINGVGGNLVSVQANNMGSLLYQRVELGQMPEGTRICETPPHTFCYGTIYARISRILIFVSVPGNFILAYAVEYLYKTYINMHIVFVICFVFSSLILLLILLWCAHCLVHLLWRMKMDPDTGAIPFLTACGDSFGTGILAIMFYCLKNSKYEYQGRIF